VKRFAVIAVLLGALGVAATVVLSSLPAEEFILAPDRATPLEDKVRVEGARPAGDKSVYYVDVFVRRTSLLERLLPFTRPEGSTVVPEDVLLPPGTTEEDRDRQTAAEMQRSEKIAALVALRELGYDVHAQPLGALVAGVVSDAPAAGVLEAGDVVVAVDGTKVRTPHELRAEIAKRRPGEDARLTVRRGGRELDVTVGTIPTPGEPERPFIGIQVDQAADIDLPIDVDIDLGRVGGPSAGLPFALEISRLLGRDVTPDSCRVAATGELAFDGSVISVGGVPQKTIGARRADVDVFLVPAGRNAQDAREHADDVRVVPVENFRQALRYLTTSDLKC